MNKKILGSFFILGLFTGTAQTANVNEALANNALFAQIRANAINNGSVQNQGTPEEPTATPIQAQNRQTAEEEFPPPPPEMLAYQVNDYSASVEQNNPEQDGEGIVGNNDQPAQPGFIQRLFPGWFGEWGGYCIEQVAPAPPSQQHENASTEGELPPPPLQLLEELQCENTPTDSGENAGEKRYTEDEIHACPVCLQPLLTTDEDDYKLFATPCQHFYHKKCLTDALQRSETCSMCRTNLDTKHEPIEIAAEATSPEISELKQHISRLENENISLLVKCQQTCNALALNKEELHKLTTNASMQRLTVVGSAGAGAIAATYMPDTADTIKKVITTTATKACNLAYNYPKEVAGIAVGATGLYALQRGGMTIRNTKEFAKKHATEVALLTAIIFTTSMVLEANNK